MSRQRRPRPRIATLGLTLAFLCGTLAAAPVAGAAPGDLDPTFGAGGIALTPFASDDVARDLVVQADGGFVVAGVASDSSASRFALARYDADGTLDTGFGSAGKVVTTVGSTAFVNAVALQPDGKIVAAGRASGAFALARYNADGSLDTSFSGDGLVTTSIGSEATAWDVAVQPDGRIVVAGQAHQNGSDRFAIARYNSNGSLDSGFGSSGKTTTVVGTSDSYGLGLVRQADGRLVVAGGASDGTTLRFALVRYTSAGVLDTTFGSAGSVVSPVGTGAAATSVVSDADGRLVVAGGASDGASYKTAVARYSAGGAADVTFGTGGLVLALIGEASLGNDVAIQADGAIVVASEVFNTSAHAVGLTRLTPGGTLDASFGDGGSVATAIGVRGAAYGTAIQPDGGILVAGSGDENGSARRFAVARYESAPDPEPTPDPTPDPTPEPTPEPQPTPGGGLEGQIVAPSSLGDLPLDVKPIVLPAQTLKLTSEGLVPVRLRCIELPDADCVGTVVITLPASFVSGPGNHRMAAARRRPSTRIARRTVRIRSGRSATANLRLTSAGKRALKRARTLRVEVAVSMRVGDTTRTSRRTVTLRAPRSGR